MLYDVEYDPDFGVLDHESQASIEFMILIRRIHVDLICHLYWTKLLLTPVY